jgi:hypothetical protein
MATDYSSQIDRVIKLLDGSKFTRDSPVFEQSIQWIEFFPHAVDETRRRKLLQVVTTAFGITEGEIYAKIARATSTNGIHLPIEASEEKALEDGLPKTGWLKWYVEYTRGLESPLSYHIFCSLAVLGSALGRRVYIDKGGFFRIYPNYCVILIGPTGRVAKTSAVDVATKFIREMVLCPIMADAITPEALVMALGGSGHHFVYAPEMAVFFGKQKYNEGLTTLMLRLLDCPDSYTRKTLTAGEVTITNIALTLLGGSTLSLLAGSTPDQVTSSGFLNRFMLVVENDTPREFPDPIRGAPELRTKMLALLDRFKAFSGEVRYTPQATLWFANWYHQRKQMIRMVENEMTAEVIQRGASHFERTVMLIHLAHCDNFEICVACCEVAAHLMRYIEKRIPQTVAALSQSVVSKDTDHVVQVLRRLGGVSDRSNLMRRVASRMDKAAFDRHIATLKEHRSVREEKRGLATIYILEAIDGAVA